MNYVFSEAQLNNLIAHVYELPDTDRAAIEAARANRNNRRTLQRRVRSSFFLDNEIPLLSDKAIEIATYAEAVVSRVDNNNEK